MKKIITLALALVAVLGHAQAQREYMTVLTYNDGTVELYHADEVASITYGYDTWSPYAKGTYYFNVDNDGEYRGSNDVTIYRSDVNPTRFYIKDWNKGMSMTGSGGVLQQAVDLYYTYNETTGEVYVDAQYTGRYDASGDANRYWWVQDVVSRNEGNTAYGASFYTDEGTPAQEGYWLDDPELPGNDVWVNAVPAIPAHSIAFFMMYYPMKENTFMGGYTMCWEYLTFTEKL